MDTRTAGHTDTWTRGRTDTRTHGHSDTLTHGHTDTWKHGRSDTRTQGHMETHTFFLEENRAESGAQRNMKWTFIFLEGRALIDLFNNEKGFL